MSASMSLATQNHVLVLAPIGRDAELIRGLLLQAGVESEIARSLNEVTERIRESTYAAVIVAEEAIAAESAHGLRGALEAQPTWSDIPIIVLLSAHSGVHPARGKYLIDLFAPSGNISLMERPFHPSTLVSSAQVAVRARQRQYEVRDLVDQLQLSLRQRDMFMSAASHELKTPLTSLRLRAQLGIRAIESGDKRVFQEAQVVRTIQDTDRQVSRLARLIDEMLDVTSIQVGKLALNLERFDLRELVREVVDLYQPQFLEVSCSLKLDEAPLFGLWDRYRIEQVITNLLTNALKYGERRPVEVCVKREGDVAVIEVTDQGGGIAPEDQVRIFERFERATSATNISGLGLGLFITKNILELHQGRIHVASNVGRGSTFRVELPLEVEMQGTGSERPPEAEAVTETGFSGAQPGSRTETR